MKKREIVTPPTKKQHSGSRKTALAFAGVSRLWSFSSLCSSVSSNADTTTSKHTSRDLRSSVASVAHSCMSDNRHIHARCTYLYTAHAFQHFDLCDQVGVGVGCRLGCGSTQTMRTPTSLWEGWEGRVREGVEGDARRMCSIGLECGVLASSFVQSSVAQTVNVHLHSGHPNGVVLCSA